MVKIFIHILRLKEIPKLYWSSPFEYNLKPKKITIFYLVLGLILFGIGEALLITANLGVSPWFVLHQGLAFKTGYTIGITTFFVSVAVLLLWFPLKQKPGIGTILNAILISVILDLSLIYLPYPKDFLDHAGNAVGMDKTTKIKNVEVDVKRDQNNDATSGFPDGPYIA